VLREIEGMPYEIAEITGVFLGTVNCQSASKAAITADYLDEFRKFRYEES